MNVDWASVRVSLVGKAVNLLGNKAGLDFAAEAEDLAQDALIVLLEKEPKDTEEATRLGLAILTRDGVDHIRKEVRRREIEQDAGDVINRNLGAEFTGDDPEQVAMAEERVERVDELTPLLRNTLEAYYIDGKTYEELAAIEGCTEAVIRKRIQRARDILLENNNNE